MNREAKVFHPVYNNMAFPDRLDQPARTVTATCTRVSRESIVIADPRATGRFRRLTIRERACLQGFPITYQFHARSFAEKAKMVGNAIPPTFTHLVALAAQGVQPERLDGFVGAGRRLRLPEKVAAVTRPDTEGRSYPARRGFRAAVPGLRFKSGMRFDLSNDVRADGTDWRVRFFFGPSKDIREVELDGSTWSELRRELAGPNFASFRARLVKAEQELAATSPQALQDRWTHRADGPGPYDVVDLLGSLTVDLVEVLGQQMKADPGPVRTFVRQRAESAPGRGPTPGLGKVEKYAVEVLAGLIVGDWFNGLGWHASRRAAA